jgi:mannose-1-phosphate guanylyltransferase
MKAVILSGGFGTRLRPLTCSRPKQLLPLGTSTLIGYLLDQLRQANIAEVILATGHDIEHLQEYLGDGAAYNLKIHYSIESTPLGTAGAIKHAEPFLQGENIFLVLNGDIVSDISYSQMINHHKQHKATATIALFQVEDPSRFGVVELTPEGRIRQFVEKPAPGLAPSNLINAGCYVLDNTVLDKIPSNREVSIEREVFPNLCKSTKVMGWEHQGFWVDTGTPASFLEAHHALLTKMHKSHLIGEDAQIASSAEIGSNVTIGKHAIIGPKTRITNSVIFEDAIIGEGTIINEAIIGQGVVIGKALHLEKQVIVGDGAIIDAGANIPPGTIICPKCHIKKDETPPPCFVKNYQSLGI